MAKLNENISKIEKGSALDVLYNRLLIGFSSSQDDALPDYTSSDYVSEIVDETGIISYIADENKINASIAEHKEIAIKNSAYLLASCFVNIDGNGGGSGETGGSGGLFVAVTGDSMTGKLNAMYGFSSGDNGIKILDVYQTTEEKPEDRKSIVSINGELHLNSHGLYINGWNVISYDNDVLSFDAQDIALNGDVTCTGSITLGDTVISEDGISIGDKDFYHSGNCNKEDVDWTMKDGTIAGKLLVKGVSEFQSNVTALNGIILGVNSKPVLSITEDNTAQLNGNFNIVLGGIMIDGDYVIHAKNKDVISFSAPNKILNLGDDDTKLITLQTSVFDDDGEYELLSKFGDAYFPNSFKAGFSLGNVLIETYKNSNEDSGVLIHRYLRFNNLAGPGFYSDGTVMFFESPFKYNMEQDNDTVQITEHKTTTLGYEESESLYAPLNRKSASLFFNTEADFYVFDKRLEGKNSIGIAKSKTRLLANQLFFDDSVYWLSISDGVKHYGNAYMVNDIGSVEFSSGFAGNGWKIYKNQLTGNICAVFDELTVRKKMRLYELEVQKQSVMNGSFWVSDACSGDLVEEVV